MTINKFNHELTNRIKEIRINQGISQKELASAVNLKVSNLSKYENLKECVPIVNFNNICNYLKISFDYALNITDINNYNDNRKELDKYLIGERLKKIRKDNNLYQETLAMNIGTSKSLICEYEKGKKLLSLPYAYAICKKYNISMDYIMGKIDNPEYLK